MKDGFWSLDFSFLNFLEPWFFLRTKFWFCLSKNSFKSFKFIFKFMSIHSNTCETWHNNEAQNLYIRKYMNAFFMIGTDFNLVLIALLGIKTVNITCATLKLISIICCMVYVNMQNDIYSSDWGIWTDWENFSILENIYFMHEINIL